MKSTIAFAGVACSAAYLIGFALLAAFKPDRAARFMQMFAASATAHFTEMLARIVAGVAFVYAAPRMTFGPIFEVFGWTLIATSLVLALMPWRWHRWFARNVIPTVITHLRLYGLCSMLLGAFVLACLVIGGNG